MPKILLFAPCDKVIVSTQDNTTSLISIIEAFTIDIPEDAEVPEQASIPIVWHVLTIWEKEEGDIDKNFEQMVRLFLPDGTKAMDASSTIDFEPIPKRFRMVTMVRGFPVSPSGTCLLKLLVREVAQETWREVGEFPLEITRTSPAPQQPETGNEESATEATEVG